MTSNGSSAESQASQPLVEGSPEVVTEHEFPDGANDWLLRDAIFDRVGEVYTDDIVVIVRDWLATYERTGCSLGDAQAELRGL